MSRFIHLLYVPTMNCNMACKYCYLGENTEEIPSDKSYLETLKYAVEKLRAADVIPFNISLHGGEVTTLSKEDFRSVIDFIDTYYKENAEIISSNGFRVGKPHIKTNLYNIAKHIDTIRDYNVTISGSLDLPFSMHDKYRITKGGEGTLSRILENLKLFASLPNHKKVSSTLFHEHFTHLDEIMEDIEYLAENTCLDMNDFNFMIGFVPETDCGKLLSAMSEEEMTELYRRMHERFDNTSLDKGVNSAWFAEFTTDYCTNCDICGDKFFLLEKNGDIYSCVRGQGNPDFYYGNIFNDSVEEILQQGHERIYQAHSKAGITQECIDCEHLHLCKTGCPFVKTVYKSSKSYTCLLQKELYRDGNYPHIPEGFAEHYLEKMHPESELVPSAPPKENSLQDLISRDSKLQVLYDSTAFILKVDGVEYPLSSQLLKRKRDIIFIGEESEVKIYVRNDYLDRLSPYPYNNALWVMLLSGDTIVYGDEGREKQEHVMTHLIYKGTLERYPSDKEGYFCANIGGLLSMYGKVISKTRPNNLFFTTTDIRDYHYTKQKNNAFYHMNAINLPFQNIELQYVNEENLAAMFESIVNDGGKE